MKLKKYMALPLIYVISQIGFAEAKPESCPDLAVIKAEGITKVEYTSTMGWLGINKSNYGTLENWGLYLVLLDFSSYPPKQPANEQGAWSNAISFIATFTQVLGPEKNQDDAWACMYWNENSKETIAGVMVTPPSIKIALTKLSAHVK